VNNRAMTATLMAVAVRTAVVNPLPTGGSVSSPPSRVAGPRGAWPGEDGHGLLRAFSSSRASWRLRSMEEGSVELIVRAGGCGGLDGRRRSVSQEISYGPRGLHVPVSDRPPMDSRAGQFSGPVGVLYRVPRPVQKRRRTSERSAPSRGTCHG
jgi:hypothetical protein